jgi:poly-gamma-glutamate synthesis protein (capsule biosynthesis protein)
MPTLLFAGDLSLCNIDAPRFRIDPAIAPVFASADYRIANLEAPLTNHKTKISNRAWYMKGDPIMSPILEQFDAFSLANNHVLDYEAQGVADTKAFLGTHQKGYFGAGQNIVEACQPFLTEVGGIKLAFIGTTGFYNATQTSAGTAPLAHPLIFRAIRILHKKGYFVTVIPHWHYEHIDYPAPVHRKLGMRYIDAGADLVIGSHPHNVLGYEKYRGKWLFHSLGNFVFHSTQFRNLSDKRLFQTFLAGVRIDPDHSYTVEVHPLRLTDEALLPMAIEEGKAFLTRLNELSAILSTSQYPGVFYYHAGQIVTKSVNAIKKADPSRFPILSIIRRLPRATRQDILLQLHVSIGRLRSRFRNHR